jgi:hypothetical protein
MHRARLFLAASLLFAGACQTNAPTPQHATDKLPSAGLAAAQPADIAVAPIRDETGREPAAAGAPLAAVRQAIYTGLVDRLYSPVSLDYLDRQWTEASFGGAGAADAVLEIAITKWDTTHVSQRGVVLARAVGKLVDAKNPEGQPLWAVGITRRLDLGGPGPAGDWQTRAAGMLAAELLAELPLRDAIRANR